MRTIASRRGSGGQMAHNKPSENGTSSLIALEQGSKCQHTSSQQPFSGRSSVVVGMVPSFAFSTLMHSVMERRFPRTAAANYPDRIWWMPLMTGLFGRALFTGFAIWILPAIGPLMEAWIVVKSAG